VSAYAEAARTSRGKRPLDDAIRAIPAVWFRPSPSIYWTDLVCSVTLGWAALIATTMLSGWRLAVAFTVATLALYRALLFIHEITHISKRELPGFTLAWNAAVGVPFLLPSFLYEQVHTDHHRQRTYGTPADPEYVPYSHRPPMVMIGSAIGSLFVPALLIVRFAIVAPISWLTRRWRDAVAGHASALVINHHYVRRAPISRAGRAQEIACTIVIWLAASLWWSERLPTRFIATWFVVGAAVSAINALRTLAAHRYGEESEELTMVEQLLDSCTIDGSRGQSSATSVIWEAARALVAPVGLRFHALHHWIPGLPYHNLGRAHRLLASTLSTDAPYHATIERGFLPAIGALLMRSRARR
jgi:hypothetical protein